MKNNSKILLAMSVSVLGLVLIAMYIGITNRLDKIIAQNNTPINKCTHECIKDTSVTIDSIRAVVTGTYYNAVEGQCDASPLITADNSKIDLVKLKNREIRWVALSRDLLKRWGGPFDYGDTITIEHKNKNLVGKWVVHDSMNARFTKRMDFLVALGNKFPGKTRNVVIKKET